MNWQEKIEDFSNFLKFEKNFSDNTLDAYVRDIKKLENFAVNNLDNISPQDITYETLQEYIYQMSKNKISERSQARGISSLKAFLSSFWKKNTGMIIQHLCWKAQSWDCICPIRSV